MNRGAIGPRRRRLLRLAISTAMIAASAGSVLAQQDYPGNKPVRIIVQFQPGGSTDIIARTLAEHLSKRLGTSVVVENRSGGAGIIGTDHVAKSAPDGHTLLLSVPAPLTSNLVLYRTLPYDPRSDLVRISDVVTPRTVMVVNPEVPARTYDELLALIREQPGKFTIGSWGPGTQPHQFQVFMDKTYGLQTSHSAYKGEGPMTVDLVSGVIQLTVGSLATMKPYIDAGRLRAIAMTGPTRSPLLPDTPTFAELGYKELIYTITGPITLLAPARTPDAIVQRLSKEVGEVVRQPDVHKRLLDMGLEPLGSTAAQARAAYEAYLPVSLELTRSTGVTID